MWCIPVYILKWEFTYLKRAFLLDGTISVGKRNKKKNQPEVN